MPVASGGIHVWHMPALVEIFGDAHQIGEAMEQSCFLSLVSRWGAPSKRESSVSCCSKVIEIELCGATDRA